jgi:hypothetical protein
MNIKAVLAPVSPFLSSCIAKHCSISNGIATSTSHSSFYNTTTSPHFIITAADTSMANGTASSDNVSSCSEAPLEEEPPPATKKKTTSANNDISFLSLTKKKAPASDNNDISLLSLPPKQKHQWVSHQCWQSWNCRMFLSHMGKKQRWVTSDAPWEQGENGRVNHGGVDITKIKVDQATENDVPLLGAQKI